MEPGSLLAVVILAVKFHFAIHRLLLLTGNSESHIFM
jgi:hypothetical protein